MASVTVTISDADGTVLRRATVTEERIGDEQSLADTIIDDMECSFDLVEDGD